ncbi:hypothetical protein KUTeg_006702 [Tegillarca granosa]|uniref:Uncharacterized protein n=1 Tax=Tegillarca granosa TaxID=220873 RepID=A0ABQ9FDI6_TEGGR|nr:hypothetical protein KUTeg_006702 [Tegillarca granosa]
MLLTKWFSPTNGGKDFFISKNLKKISKFVFSTIKPPSSIERLPRDLEKHYKSLKATELQAFLLYYGIPFHYVKLWGPLWAWSCFGFEDNNANLLQLYMEQE